MQYILQPHTIQHTNNTRQENTMQHIIQYNIQHTKMQQTIHYIAIQYDSTQSNTIQHITNDIGVQCNTT